MRRILAYCAMPRACYSNFRTAMAEPLNFRRTEFVQSAAALDQLPDETVPELAFAGRSNAGKSSCLNRLTGQRNLARTSKTPGRTQLINFFTVAEQARLVDLPGYGFAKVDKRTRAEWGRLIGGFLEARDNLAGVVIIADIRRGLTDLDRQLLDWCLDADRPVHLLLNKADKLKHGKRVDTLRAVQTELKPMGPNVRCQLFSAVSGLGVETLTAALSELIANCEVVEVPETFPAYDPDMPPVDRSAE